MNDYTCLPFSVPRPTVTTAVAPADVLLIGSSVVLTCTATLDPHVDSLSSVTIAWVGPRPFSGGQDSIVESGFGLNYNSTLTISEVAQEDEGVYACTVRVFGGSNVLGTTVTESTSISVLGKTDIHLLSTCYLTMLMYSLNLSNIYWASTIPFHNFLTSIQFPGQL